MAQLDALLKALTDRNADELLLVDGAQPAMRSGSASKAVSNRVLQRNQIDHLLGELASKIDAQRLASGESVQFVYSSESGQKYQCANDPQGSPYRVCVTPLASADAPHTAQQASAPAHTPLPVSDGGAMATETATQSAASPITATQRPLRAGAPEIEKYLMQMIDSGSSDLHLCSGDRPYYRKDGEMQLDSSGPVLDSDAVRALLDPITPERNRVEFDETADTDYAYEIEGVARFRTNVFMDRKGVGAVFRQIPSDILTAEQLQLSSHILDLCHLNKGLVLVTGPTGSGKSTTLAAMIDYINRNRTDHIITIEDPIEFVHDNQKCLVNQREIITHTEGFKKALRAALREDPDIVLVGELRDLETIAIAIETAETGHLVFGTLHTNTACSTVDRIIDQFPADRQCQIRTMLSESLRGVIAQQLLKKNGGGRVAALEVLIVNHAISNLIREGKTFQIPSLMQTGKKNGMMPLNDAMAQLVKDKLVTPEEAIRRAIDRPSLESSLKKAGIKIPENID